MGRQAKTKRITSGGMQQIGGYKTPDIILQMPEVFLFDLAKYMSSVRAAMSIDHSNRVRLYDMYESARLDLHYSGVLAKRLSAVTRIPIEFQIDGKADEIITPQLSSPWFKEVRKEIILAEFWGFTLLQFYLDEEGNIRCDSINRKHYNPVRRELLRYQGDQEGIPIDNFDNMLFLGKERDLGILAELMPAILYKRGNISDWAKFCNIFGMPIRKYTYDSGDEEMRRKLIQDAKMQGGAAVYIHPKESNLELVEARNASASGELYNRFADYWDGKISIRVLGNTLTTDAKSTGTQALGTVHQEEEGEINEDDCNSILDVLNYNMRGIFAALGFDTRGGRFVYVKKTKPDPNQHVDIVLKLHSIGLPIDDDYLYEFSGIPKPDNYDAMVAEREAQQELVRTALIEGKETKEDKEGKEPSNGNRKALVQRLSGFFGLAPLAEGQLDF